MDVILNLKEIYRIRILRNIVYMKKIIAHIFYALTFAFKIFK